jgi:phosphoribosylaminoimidazole-succinocarboxamide synthase
MVIPKGIANPLTAMLVEAGLEVLHQGKVRDTFSIPGHSDKLLMVASNRISIFDFLLSATVPKKGDVLTAISAYWFYYLKSKNIDHHLIAAGANIDTYLPRELRGNPILQSCAMVVRKLTMFPVECVVRDYLTGSGWKEYQASDMVCGISLPPGLHDGSKLPETIFTPTTKAKFGHDEPMDPEEVVTKYGSELVTLSLKVFNLLAAEALKNGIIVADTKFEFGKNSKGKIVLADEVGTPDSSRFWNEEELEQATALKRAPRGCDKQFAREFGKQVSTPFTGFTTMDTLDPGHAGHVAWVDELKVPAEVVQATTERYLEIFYNLTGFELAGYQRAVLGIF